LIIISLIALYNAELVSTFSSYDLCRFGT